MFLRFKSHITVLKLVYKSPCCVIADLKKYPRFECTHTGCWPNHKTQNACMLAAVLCITKMDYWTICAEHCCSKSRDQINHKRGGNVNIKIANDVHAAHSETKAKKSTVPADLPGVASLANMPYATYHFFPKYMQWYVCKYTV